VLADVRPSGAESQLCHLIVAAGLDQVDAPWADTLTAGIRHPDQTSPASQQTASA
jgi:hypothetical protein